MGESLWVGKGCSTIQGSQKEYRCHRRVDEWDSAQSNYLSCENCQVTVQSKTSQYIMDPIAGGPVACVCP